MTTTRSAWGVLVQKAQVEVESCQKQVQSAWAQVNKAQASWESAQRMHHEYVVRYQEQAAKEHRLEDSLNQRQFLSQIQRLQFAAAQELNRARQAHRQRQQAQAQAELALLKMSKLAQLEAEKVDATQRRQDQREMDALGVSRHFLLKRSL